MLESIRYRFTNSSEVMIAFHYYRNYPLKAAGRGLTEMIRKMEMGLARNCTIATEYDAPNALWVYVSIPGQYGTLPEYVFGPEFVGKCREIDVKIDDLITEKFDHLADVLRRLA